MRGKISDEHDVSDISLKWRKKRKRSPISQHSPLNLYTCYIDLPIRPEIVSFDFPNPDNISIWITNS
eukprot:UN03668